MALCHSKLYFCYRRYHEDVVNKFQAGNISDRLRHALGLRDFEAPEYIYRMRILGYPPGWLKEAEAKRSDIALFDGTGKRKIYS